MLAYVPVRFDLYRPLAPRLRWTLQCLVAFADRAGKCWPSVRKVAEVAGLSKSTTARHLSALAVAGVITRKRRSGGVYIYEIDRRFLPAGAVSHCAGGAVPQLPDIRRATKQNIFGQDDSIRWEARLRGWKRRKMWLDFWGPKPSEAACWAPAALIERVMG